MNEAKGEKLIPYTYKWKLVAIIVTVAIISIGIIHLSTDSRSAFLAPPILINGTVQQNPDNTNITTSNNDYVSNNSSQTILLPTPKPTPSSRTHNPRYLQYRSTTYYINDNRNIFEPTPIAPIIAR